MSETKPRRVWQVHASTVALTLLFWGALLYNLITVYQNRSSVEYAADSYSRLRWSVNYLLANCAFDLVLLILFGGICEFAARAFGDMFSRMTPTEKFLEAASNGNLRAVQKYLEKAKPPTAEINKALINAAASSATATANAKRSTAS